MNHEISVPEHDLNLNEKTSDILKRLIENNPGKFLHLSYLIEQFKDRSFGGLLFILGILALLPVISFIAGVVIFIVGLQMVLGQTLPILPRFITEQKIEKRSFEGFVNQASPWLEKCQTYIKPRWFFYAHPVAHRLLGVLIMVLALVSLMPLPFSNMPPSISLLIISLGILERDGVVITIGIFLSGLAILLGYFILLLLLNSISLLT